MSTITREFTKEQLISAANARMEFAEMMMAKDLLPLQIRNWSIEAELARIALASLEAEPVAYVDPFAFNNFSVYRAGDTDNKRMGRGWMWANPDAGLIPVFTVPPAPVVPPEQNWEELCQQNPEMPIADAIIRAASWNACRAAMLQGADGKPELTVWYGAMPETNGKTNWTAILHRKGECLSTGITIDRSEYPERVRYEADRVRYLIGESDKRPCIIDYDADAHSGYVEPVTKTYKLPMQPLVIDTRGRLRFKENLIVRKLLDYATERGYGLNEIAREEFDAEDQMQLAQLIGYSLSGYGTLSYVTDESFEFASAITPQNMR